MCLLRTEETDGSMELELMAVVSLPTWALGTELGYSAGAATALKQLSHLSCSSNHFAQLLFYFHKSSEN